MKTLRNPNDILSGDTDYLLIHLIHLCKYETLQKSVMLLRTSGYRLCEEDLKVMKENTFGQLDKYREELTKPSMNIVKDWSVVYNPCDERY
jgi:hypothetical protein